MFRLLQQTIFRPHKTLDVSTRSVRNVRIKCEVSVCHKLMFVTRC